MNPGKIVDPNSPTANLRLGQDYNPREPETYFKYPEDHGSFARAALRCVGVGKCRREKGGTMCPSYMVTREEKGRHARPRASAFRNVARRSDRQEWLARRTVKDALDLCLACKGCKGDCPVNVDMATYKAEFLAHYYKGRLRPLHAYAFGLIHIWARLASLMPRVANFFTQAPIFRDVMKGSIGIAPQRRMPPFADHTFKDWFRKRALRNTRTGRRSFSGRTHSTIIFIRAPRRPRSRCWRRPGSASSCRCRICAAAGRFTIMACWTRRRRWLKQILRTCATKSAADIPLVGLEPSCLADVSRRTGESVSARPGRAAACKNSFLLSEFLEKHAKDFKYPKLQRKALVHGHCHHKSLMKMRDRMSLLDKMGLDYEMPDTGCCGMAGAFGFEKEHYDVSIACGERVLLPAVRAASKDTMLIADGFSCREQIRQTTDRVPLHLAEVVQMAIARRFATRIPGEELRYARAATAVIVERTACVERHCVYGGRPSEIGQTKTLIRSLTDSCRKLSSREMVTRERSLLVTNPTRRK